MDTNEKNRFSQSLALIKDTFAVLREAILPLLFAILLFYPDIINTKLQQAGFTKGSFAGLTWEKSVEQTKLAAQNVDQIQDKLNEINEGLAQLKEDADPNTKKSIESLLEKIRDSQDRTREADQELKQSLVTQEEVIEKEAPRLKEQVGWIYLGKIDENRTTWAAGYPKNVARVDVNTVAVGRRLDVIDEVYLRGDVDSGHRSSAAVLAVVRRGEQVEIRQVDYSHAKGGGWFIWVQVRRI